MRNWWPVAVWLGVIRLESTGFASSRNTVSRFCTRRPLLLLREDRCPPGAGTGPHSSQERTLHRLCHPERPDLSGIAKYLSGPLSPHVGRPWGTSSEPLLAMRVVAYRVAVDRGHGRCRRNTPDLLPFRTGRWQDVLIDTSGALALQVVIYLGCQLRAASQSPREPGCASGICCAEAPIGGRRLGSSQDTKGAESNPRLRSFGGLVLRLLHDVLAEMHRGADGEADCVLPAVEQIAE